MKNISNSSKRVLSLDVFRGLTIMLMILVNSQGYPVSYEILEHAPWNGCTLADLVFPFFLFIVGITLVISLKKYQQSPINTSKQLYLTIVQRSFILFLFGLVLNAFPYHFDFGTIRYYGILQRIAVCYLIASILYLNFTIRTLVAIVVTTLFAYWILLTQIPVPGVGTNLLTKEGSWVSYVDQLLFSPYHLYWKTSDPEGFLSTFPSIVTTLIGVLTGIFLISDRSKMQKAILMFASGLGLLLMGWLWGFTFPINKVLWTSSYVLWTAGYALLVFSVLFFIIDIKQWVKWTLPFKIFGMNAFFAFIFHVFLLKVQHMFLVTLPDGKVTDLKSALTYLLFNSMSQENASLSYALLFLCLNFVVVAVMYRKKWFVRI